MKLRSSAGRSGMSWNSPVSVSRRSIVDLAAKLQSLLYLAHDQLQSLLYLAHDQTCLLVGIEVGRVGGQLFGDDLGLFCHVLPDEYRPVVDVAAVPDDGKRVGAKSAELREQADCVVRVGTFVVQQQPKDEALPAKVPAEGDGADLRDPIADSTSTGPVSSREARRFFARRAKA